MNKHLLIDGCSYNLGATIATYNAETDTFQGGNYFVPRANTIFKDWGVSNPDMCSVSNMPWVECDQLHEDDCVWRCGDCGRNVYMCQCEYEGIVSSTHITGEVSGVMGGTASAVEEVKS